MMLQIMMSYSFVEFFDNINILVLDYLLFTLVTLRAAWFKVFVTHKQWVK